MAGTSTGLLLRLESPHGLVVGVASGPGDAPIELSPDDAPFAERFGPLRVRAFAAGRAAMRAALRAHDVEVGAIAPNDRGAPVVPSGWLGSISHKDVVAVALVDRDRGHRIGVDVEMVRERVVDVSSRVLTDPELAHADTLGDQRSSYVLRVFSMKEAIYKAIDPYLRRYVGFREVTIGAHDPGVAVRAELVPRPSEPELEIAVFSTFIDSTGGRFILSTAFARELHPRTKEPT